MTIAISSFCRSLHPAPSAVQGPRPTTAPGRCSLSIAGSTPAMITSTMGLTTQSTRRRLSTPVSSRAHQQPPCRGCGEQLQHGALNWTALSFRILQERTTNTVYFLSLCLQTRSTLMTRRPPTSPTSPSPSPTHGTAGTPSMQSSAGTWGTHRNPTCVPRPL